MDVGGTPMSLVDGQGYLVATAREATFAAVRLDDDILYLREELVFAFSHDLRWENGRVPGAHELALVQFRGKGVVALRTSRPLLAIRVVAGGGTQVAPEALAGWIGRVIPRRRTRRAAARVCGRGRRARRGSAAAAAGRGVRAGGGGRGGAADRGRRRDRAAGGDRRLGAARRRHVLAR
ncbi:MAG: hypothetical protein R2939_15185 [Kofleriaceae bacterium]